MRYIYTQKAEEHEVQANYWYKVKAGDVGEPDPLDLPYLLREEYVRERRESEHTAQRQHIVRTGAMASPKKVK